MSSSDSDSASENELNQFKEAVDTEFLKDELYNPTKNKKILDTKKIKEKETLPSLRNVQKEDYSWNPYSIRVTPEFRNYIGKQLAKALDKSIDDTEAFQNPVKASQESDNGGVKLLSTSKKFLSLEKPNDDTFNKSRTKTQIKKRKCDDERDTDSSEEERRIKEAAVSPEWILSGEEIKHWAPSTKGEVEVIQGSGKKRKKKKKRKED